jgi:hypothetical protein
MSFVCDLSVMNDEQRARHVQIARELMAEDRQEVVELADGFAFRFAADSTMCIKIAQFISNERLCCPFFNFALEVTENSGAMWLRITGREGVKQFMQSELG